MNQVVATEENLENGKSRFLQEYKEDFAPRKPFDLLDDDRENLFERQIDEKSDASFFDDEENMTEMQDKCQLLIIMQVFLFH